MYISTRVYTCMYACVRVLTHVYVDVGMCTCLCICVRVSTQVCVYPHTQADVVLRSYRIGWRSDTVVRRIYIGSQRRADASAADVAYDGWEPTSGRCIGTDVAYDGWVPTSGLCIGTDGVRKSGPTCGRRKADVRPMQICSL